MTQEYYHRVGWQTFYYANDKNRMGLSVYVDDQNEAREITRKLCFKKSYPEYEREIVSTDRHHVLPSDQLRYGDINSAIHGVTFLAFWGISTGELNFHEMLSDHGTLHTIVHFSSIKSFPTNHLYPVYEKLVEQENRVKGYKPPHRTNKQILEDMEDNRDIMVPISKEGQFPMTPPIKRERY